MKILRICFEKIRVFDEKFEIDLYATDKVVKSRSVHSLTSKIASLNVAAFVGINATGKTTALRLVQAAFDIVGDNKGLDQLDSLKEILMDGSRMIVDFFHENCFFRLDSIFGFQESLFFKDESIFRVPQSQITSKIAFREMSFEKPFLQRKDFLPEAERNYSFLKPSDSIIAAITRDVSCSAYNSFLMTNHNFYFMDGIANPLYLKLLDPSIQGIEKKGDDIVISLINDKKKHVVNQWSAESFLSSGTIKGSISLWIIEKVLEKGGCLLVDEIENHLNKRLVQTLIELFQDTDVNKKGATLLFSTHYVEILDCFSRKDNIFVCRKTNNGNCSVVKFSDQVSRNDIKKSEVLLSNMIEGTAPSYEAIQAIKEYLCQAPRK